MIMFCFVLWCHVHVASTSPPPPQYLYSDVLLGPAVIKDEYRIIWITFLLIWMEEDKKKKDLSDTAALDK